MSLTEDSAQRPQLDRQHVNLFFVPLVPSHPRPPIQSRPSLPHPSSSPSALHRRRQFWSHLNLLLPQLLRFRFRSASHPCRKFSILRIFDSSSASSFLPSASARLRFRVRSVD